MVRFGESAVATGEEEAGVGEDLAERLGCVDAAGAVVVPVIEQVGGGDAERA